MIIKNTLKIRRIRTNEIYESTNFYTRPNVGSLVVLPSYYSVFKRFEYYEQFINDRIIKPLSLYENWEDTNSKDVQYRYEMIEASMFLSQQKWIVKGYILVGYMIMAIIESVDKKYVLGVNSDAITEIYVSKFWNEKAERFSKIYQPKKL